MVFVPPVRAGSSLQQRNTRDKPRPFSRSFAEVRSAVPAEPLSLRPNAPIANIPMLLEILSAAGEPANQTTARLYTLHRRAEDNRRALLDENQFSFDFIR